MVKIKVTWRDINEGKQTEQRSCMVSQAIMRELELDPRRYYISTGYDRVAIGVKGRKGGKRAKRVFTQGHSERVTEKIMSFDESRESVKPFEFEWDLPDDWRAQLAKVSDELQK